ncbi:hypothetical protein BSM4216_1469 [Bacillus smithii]|nr:hypothetical protein BSM4216_1469 [Bacillus smithii]
MEREPGCLIILDQGQKQTLQTKGNLFFIPSSVCLFISGEDITN